MTMTAVAPVAAANPLYKQRIETTYEVKAGFEDAIERLIAKHIAYDTDFPAKQNLNTIYFRAVPHTGKGSGRGTPPDTDFRIRSYPDTPKPDGSIFANLEFKDEVEQGGQVVRTKTSAPVKVGDHLRLLDGELAIHVIGRKGRTGEALQVAERGIDLIDNQGLQPVMRGRYHRTTFTNAAGELANTQATPVRLTLDRDITHVGIGQLAGAGEVKRGVALLDVKVSGSTPEWLAGLIDEQVKAGVLQVAERGKGGTAVRELAKMLPKFRRV